MSTSPLVFGYGVVYLIRNEVNHKIYVGQTTRAPKRRLQNHIAHAFVHLSGKYKGRDTPLFRAIRKYGKDSFSISVICVCSSPKELDIMEDLYILSLGALDKMRGYNVRRGGPNGEMVKEVKKTCGYPKGTFRHSDESRLKMSKTTKDNLAKNPRPPVSASTRAKISASGKNRKVSNESRQKSRESQQGEAGNNYNHSVKTSLLVALYEMGYSCKSISKVVPLTDSGVRHRIKDAGIVSRPCSTRPNTSLSPIEELDLCSLSFI